MDFWATRKLLLFQDTPGLSGIRWAQVDNGTSLSGETVQQANSRVRKEASHSEGAEVYK